MISRDSVTASSKVFEALVAGLVGAWLGLSLLKFGNPVILDRMVSPPTSYLQFLIQPWPVSWGYWMLGALLLVSLKVWRWHTSAPPWLVAWPLAWLVWQIFAGTQTVEPSLTQVTLVHFSSCVVCFYLGHFALCRTPSLKLLTGAWLVGFLMVIASGFQQHFGGLEETRKFFYLYELPKLPQGPPPELLKKLASDRIYGTLFYPNTLAGVIILVLPIGMIFLSELPRLTGPARAFLVGIVASSSLACLYWSGSKAGWLIVLGMAAVAFLRCPVNRRVRWVILLLIMVVGLAGFFIKYSDYFKGGATSVGARFDYWKAALKIVQEKPIFGSGPGTFSVLYGRLKAPGAEMARLAHNDYLQQASDSGIIGFLLYAGFISVVLVRLYRKSTVRIHWFPFSIWLGLFGVAMQGLFEFGLFIPAVAWPQFLFLGLLTGNLELHPRNQIDNEFPGR